MRFIFTPGQEECGYYTAHDGCITINLAQITEFVDSHGFCQSENLIISNLIDTIIHESLHKAFDEYGDYGTLSNDQEEKAMKVCRDWVERDKKTSFLDLA